MYLSTFQKPSAAELGYQTVNYIRQKRLPCVKRITLRALLRHYPLPGEHEQTESMTQPEMAVGSSRQRVAQNHAGPEALGRTVRDRRQFRDQVDATLSRGRDLLCRAADALLHWRSTPNRSLHSSVSNQTSRWTRSSWRCTSGTQFPCSTDRDRLACKSDHSTSTVLKLAGMTISRTSQSSE